MKSAQIFTAVILASSLVFAAGPKASPKATKAASTTKKDVAGTVKWTGYGIGKSHTGDITLKSGKVELKGKEIVGGTFVLDMKTLKTGDSPKLQGHLQSADFFDIEKYPEATFKITKVEAAPPQAAQTETHKIWGDLTIKGKTNPAEIDATITEDKGAWKAVGTTEIKDRTKYDIVYNSKQFKAASALGDKLIEDNIKIELNLTTK